MRGLATLFLLASALVITPTYSNEGTTLKGPKGVDYGAQGRSIGPIKPTDTLWRIAAKVRPDNSVSIYQVMQALYEKNPSSFLDQNLNHMRDGAYLKIPTIAEMRAVNATLAKARSEQDDELWERKKNGTLTTAQINESQKKVTQARKVDVDEAKQELKQEINTIKAEQGTQLVELQKQFKSSVENVEEILEENNKLKNQLTGISKELETVRNQLGQDSEIQKQLKELIDKQNEIIEQQRAKKIEQDSGINFSSLLSNPFVLGALMFIPALLVIGGVIMFLKKRNRSEPESTDDDEFLPQSPSFSSEEELDPIIDSDPLVPEPEQDSDDLSVRLDDDDLEQDMLPDDDIIFDDSIDDAFDEDDDNVLNQDELEGLLSDDIVFNDDTPEQAIEDDELDSFLQQDFDQSDDDGLGDEIDLDSEASGADTSGDILSADDIDNLFENDDSLDDSLESSSSNDEMAALSEELAEEDFDIDSLIDEQQDAADDTHTSIDNDDIDDLLDEPSTEPDAELIDEDDFDIDSLIDEAQTDDSEPAPVEEGDLVDGDEAEDAFDLDDIDSLIDEAAEEQNDEQAPVEPDADALVDEDEIEDDFDLDDIDSLIDEAAEEQNDKQAPVEPDADALVDEDDIEEGFDLDDIDSLIDEAAEEQNDEQAPVEPDADSLVDEDDIDLDDIDSLINEAAEDQNDEPTQVEPDADALVDEDEIDDAFDVDDIDSLIDETAQEQADEPAYVEPDADALVDEDEIDDALDVDDIDSPIDEAAEEQSDEPAYVEPDADALVDENEIDDALDVDDIDSLIDEAAEEQADEPAHVEPDADALVDEDDIDDVLDVDDIDSLTDEDELDDSLNGDDELALDDIDELIQEANELKQDTQAQISELSDSEPLSEHDENLTDSLEDLADAEQAIDDARVEELASELNDDADIDEVDIDEAINTDFSENSDDLLDDDDSLDEYDDPSLKSVDELLSEIGEEEEYVAAPDWSIDEPNEDFEEVEIDLGDDPLAEEEPVDDVDLDADDEPLSQDMVTPSQELEEYPELEFDELETDEIVDETTNETELTPSQAEQDLADSLATAGVDQLDDDFDDEILIDNEFTEDDLLDSDEENTQEGDNLLDLGTEHEQEQTLADKEPASTDDFSDISDDDIDDDFMADLTQTDFDALLNELAEPDDSHVADASEFDVDFNALLNEDLQIDDSNSDELETTEPNSTSTETTVSDEFVDIDSLLEQSDDEALDYEPYDDVDMDVGLSDFDDLLAGDNPTDVDAESGGYSAKLDLARAYIEIDDFDSALQAIEDVINNGPDEVQAEAQSLKAKLNG